jgi:hypothetical protein
MSETYIRSAKSEHHVQATRQARSSERARATNFAIPRVEARAENREDLLKIVSWKIREI